MGLYNIILVLRSAPKKNFQLRHTNIISNWPFSFPLIGKHTQLPSSIFYGYMLKDVSYILPYSKLIVHLCSLFFVKFLRQDRGTYKYFVSFAKELYEWSILLYTLVQTKAQNAIHAGHQSHPWILASWKIKLYYSTTRVVDVTFMQ